jgi:hypothetical protein
MSKAGLRAGSVEPVERQVVRRGKRFVPVVAEERSRCFAVLVGAVVAGSLNAPASVLAGSADTVQIHGFVSQGLVKSTANNYLTRSRRGSVDYTEAGVNVTARPTDDLFTGMQVFYRRLGDQGDYQADVDWAFLEYRQLDWFGVRAGRLRLPYGLYNKTVDVDMAYVPALLPQGMYGLSGRDFRVAVNGFSLHGRLDLGSAGDLQYEVIGGNMAVRPSTFFPVRSRWTYVVDLAWNGSTSIGLFRAGLTYNRTSARASYPLSRTYADLLTGFGVPEGTTELDVDMSNYRAPTVYFEYIYHGFLLAAEYNRKRASTSSVLDTLPEPFASAIGDYDVSTAYVMAKYSLLPWLHASTYYSWVANTALEGADAEAPEASLRDLALGARVDVNRHWCWKLEGHYMDGLHGLAGNFGYHAAYPTASPKEKWGLFLLKTTVYY